MSKHDQNFCTHTTIKSVWKESYIDYFMSDEKEGYWADEEVSTTVDLDLYRYKCTQCGKVEFYSGGAKKLYEEQRKR